MICLIRTLGEKVDSKKVGQGKAHLHTRHSINGSEITLAESSDPGCNAVVVKTSSASEVNFGNGEKLSGLRMGVVFGDGEDSSRWCLHSYS